MGFEEDFSFHSRHTLIDSPSYLFEVEELRRGADQMLLLHLDVHKWSPSVFKEMHRVWHDFRQCVTAPVFGFGHIDDEKWERFVRSFGFKPLSIVKCNDGFDRRLFIHVKDFPSDGFEPTAGLYKD